MAIIYWKFGHLTAEGFQRPLDSFLIFRDGRVFDVDSTGWDRGIRAGAELAEMKWRHPSATWIPWQAGYYQKPLASLEEWLRAHAASFQQTDLREGWWEWPRLTEQDWRRLMDEVVPRWAQRMEAGVASHPWMAHWIAEEGESLKLPAWTASFWRTYVLYPKQEEQLWPRLPLRYVEGIPAKVRQGWNKRRWERVEDVPGLLSRIRQPQDLGQSQVPGEMVLTRSFDEPLAVGIGDMMRELGHELAGQCRVQNRGVQFLRVTWFRAGGIERREREWPTPAGDEKAVVSRVLSLLNHPPMHPFDRVQLEARIEPLSAAQMKWWEHAAKRPQPPALAGLSRFSVSRRELLLQYWDLWRMAGDHG